MRLPTAFASVHADTVSCPVSVAQAIKAQLPLAHVISPFVYWHPLEHLTVEQGMLFLLAKKTRSSLVCGIVLPSNYGVFWPCWWTSGIAWSICRLHIPGEVS